MFVIPTHLVLLLFSLLVPCNCLALSHPHGLSILKGRWHAASSRMASQGENPSNVLTILLIVRGDIVQKALAQLSGGHFVPVAFSFGWVTYSINALIAAFCDGSLMTSIKFPSTIIDVQSGYARFNYSWILNRVLRGIESSLEPLDAALCVSVYRCKPYSRRAPHDWLWWSGVITIGLQLSISRIPFAVYGDWTIMLVTTTGTLLALVGGSLPQWRNEKWGNHFDEKGYTFCLTRGIGFRHVVIIQNEPSGCLHLESLALPRRVGCSRSCKSMVPLSALLWILFLVNVCGLRQHTWYLLVVGFIGMVQNVCVAAILRQPCATGLLLALVERIEGKKVMNVLMETEIRFPAVGAYFVRTFFPGELREDEQKFWSARELKTSSTFSATRTQTSIVVPLSESTHPEKLTPPWDHPPVTRERRSTL